MSLFDSASLIVTPNGVKEDKLYSIKPSDGSGDLVVTRATTATRVNSDGLIEVTPYNLLTYSNTFTNADWGNNQGSLTSGQTGYDGSSNAYKLQATGTSCYIVQGSYNFTRYQSIYAKAGNYSQISFIVGGYGNGVRFNLTNGTVADNTNTSYFTPTIESVGNGWYLCSVAVSSTAPTYGFLFAPNYVAGGNSTSGDYIYIQNAQLVSGTSAKEYFPTTDRLDIPRLDYTNSSCPSILVEPQRTNSAKWSEDFSNGFWAKDSTTTLTANADISPDGTQNADRFESPSNIKGLFSYGISNSETISIYVKAGNSTNIGKSVNFFSSTAQQNFVLTNSWQRISVTGATSNLFALYPSDSNGFTNILIWGAQAESGSYATSYIPTQASSVTRNADVISKTGISSLIGQTEGTLFWDINVDIVSSADSENIINIDNGFFGTTLYLIKTSTGNLGGELYNGGVVQFSASTPITQKGRYKCALAYKTNDFALYINGVQIAIDSSGTVGAMSRLQLGQGVLGASVGNINTTAIWKERLSNTELAQLTTI